MYGCPGPACLTHELGSWIPVPISPAPSPPIVLGSRDTPRTHTHTHKGTVLVALAPKKMPFAYRRRAAGLEKPGFLIHNNKFN